jgi:hypothetical protein
MPLAKVRQILDDPGFDHVAALEHHRGMLQGRMERLFNTCVYANTRADAPRAHGAAGAPAEDDRPHDRQTLGG